MNDRSDINRNDTDSTDLGTENQYSGLFPDVYCAQLNYTVSNDYIAIVSTIASDCSTDPAEIPIGRSFELRYNPMNPRDFIKQSEYYDDITNLCIRIVLSVIMTMTLISFIIKYRNLPDDVETFVGDPRFGRGDLETGGEPQESQEARKERILSKMVFQCVSENWNNTITADAVRSYQKETSDGDAHKESNSETEPTQQQEESNNNDLVPVEDERKNTESSGGESKNITIETVDGTHSSPECATEEDMVRKVGANQTLAVNSTSDQTDTRIDKIDGGLDSDVQNREENTPKQVKNGDGTTTACPPTCAENSFEERTSAPGNILQSMLSSWMRSESESEAECCICLDRYDPGDTICASKNIECNHVFHKDCMMDWMMKNHNQCPLCRVDLLK